MTERAPDSREEPPRRPDDDINVRGVVVFVVGVFALLGVAAALSAVIALDLEHELRGRDPAPSPLAEANAPVTPPPPRLQVNPAEDLAAMRAAERAILESYGWVDREAGVARIPIERALDLAASRPELITRRPGGNP
jgi:hypothetical protein